MGPVLAQSTPRILPSGGSGPVSRRVWTLGLCGQRHLQDQKERNSRLGRWVPTGGRAREAGSLLGQRSALGRWPRSHLPFARRPHPKGSGEQGVLGSGLEEEVIRVWDTKNTGVTPKFHALSHGGAHRPRVSGAPLSQRQTPLHSELRLRAGLAPALWAALAWAAAAPPAGCRPPHPPQSPSPDLPSPGLTLAWCPAEVAVSTVASRIRVHLCWPSIQGAALPAGWADAGPWGAPWLPRAQGLMGRPPPQQGGSRL